MKKLNRVSAILAWSISGSLLLSTVPAFELSPVAAACAQPRDITGRWAPDEKWTNWQEDFNRGFNAYKRHDYALAQKIYLKSLQRAKSFGDNPSKCVEVLAKLICAIIDQGDAKKAEPYFQELMALSIKLNQKNALDELAAMSIEDLASTYVDSSGVTKDGVPKSLAAQLKARYALEHAIDIQSKVFGEKHPRLIMTRGLCAGVCIVQKDWNAAREQLEKIQIEMRGMSGKTWVHNSRWLIYLGCVYDRLGRKADAKRIFGELKMQFDHAGLTGDLEKYRGDFYCISGDYDNAELWFRKQLADSLRDKSEYKQLCAIRNLGYVAEGRGRFAEAEKLFRKAYEMAKVAAKQEGTYRFPEMANEVERSMRKQNKNKEADLFHRSEAQFLLQANPRFKSAPRLYKEELEIMKDIDSISNQSRSELRKK